MKELKVLRAKPNPAGKDKVGTYAPNSQLVAEWVDIQNVSGHALNMQGVSVCDRMFTHTCRDEGRRTVFTFAAYSMPANTVVRIHSGKRVEISALASEDRVGADAHAFTGESYVWNNTCGDTAEILSEKGYSLDKASYAPHAAEGEILVRSGDYLV